MQKFERRRKEKEKLPTIVVYLSCSAGAPNTLRPIKRVLTGYFVSFFPLMFAVATLDIEYSTRHITEIHMCCEFLFMFPRSGHKHDFGRKNHQLSSGAWRFQALTIIYFEPSAKVKFRGLRFRASKKGRILGSRIQDFLKDDSGHFGLRPIIIWNLTEFKKKSMICFF